MDKQNQKKKLYQKIVDNRYLFSILMLVILTIVGFFTNNVEIKEWIVETDKALSLWSNIKFFALILASYELFYIITNKKQNISIAGALALAFSGCVFWNLNKIDAVVLGEIITVLIYKMVNTENKKKNILMMLVIISCSIGYMYTFRPFAISFGYLFFALIIWILAQNRKNLKEDKSKTLMITSTIIVSIIAAVCAELFLGNYYGDAEGNGVTASISGLFTYLYTPLLPFNEIGKNALWGGIFSIFPIPMCVALYYMYKKEEHSEFLLPITVVAVLETVYCISGFPEIISKFTMLSGASAVRVVPAVQLANLFIIFYFLGNIEETIFKLKHAFRITIIALCILVLIKYPTQFATNGFLYLFAAEFTLLTFMFLNYSDKKYQKVFLFFLVLVSLIGGVPVLFL